METFSDNLIVAKVNLLSTVIPLSRLSFFILVEYFMFCIHLYFYSQDLKGHLRKVRKINFEQRADCKTILVFVIHECPRRQQSQNMAKSLRPNFLPPPHSRGMRCQ